MRNEIEELRRIIKLKEEEISSLKAGEAANAFNPQIFLKNNIREEFWQKIVLTQEYSSEKAELLSKIQKLKSDANFEKKKLNQRIDALLAKNEELLGYKAEYENLKLTIVEMERHLNQNEIKIESLHAENHYLKKEMNILKELDESNKKHMTGIEDEYLKSKNDCDNERKKLADRIQKLTNRKSKKKGLMRIAGEFRAT